MLLLALHRDMALPALEYFLLVNLHIAYILACQNRVAYVAAEGFHLITLTGLCLDARAQFIRQSPLLRAEELHSTDTIIVMLIFKYDGSDNRCRKIQKFVNFLSIFHISYKYSNKSSGSTPANSDTEKCILVSLFTASELAALWTALLGSAVPNIALQL